MLLTVKLYLHYRAVCPERINVYLKKLLHIVKAVPRLVDRLSPRIGTLQKLRILRRAYLVLVLLAAHRAELALDGMRIDLHAAGCARPDAFSRALLRIHKIGLHDLRRVGTLQHSRIRHSYKVLAFYFHSVDIHSCILR